MTLRRIRGEQIFSYFNLCFPPNQIAEPQCDFVIEQCPLILMIQVDGWKNHKEETQNKELVCVHNSFPSPIFKKTDHNFWQDIYQRRLSVNRQDQTHWLSLWSCIVSVVIFCWDKKECHFQWISSSLLFSYFKLRWKTTKNGSHMCINQQKSVIHVCTKIFLLEPVPTRITHGFSETLIIYSTPHKANSY